MTHLKPYFNYAPIFDAAYLLADIVVDPDLDLLARSDPYLEKAFPSEKNPFY
jgi:hypothetical protein